MCFKTKIVSFVFVILLSNPVYAESEFVSAWKIISTSSIVGATLTAGAIGGGILTTDQKRKDARKRVAYFLKQNRIELRAALQLGAGKVIDDFSHLLGIKEQKREAFAHLLQKHRRFVEKNTLENISDKNVEILLKWIQEEMA